MISETCLALVVAAALADRFLFKRRKAIVQDTGSEEYIDEVIRFPVSFLTTCRNVKGARVEYCLRDKKDPTTVITGKARSLFISDKGLTREFLFFNRRYLKSGNWELVVRMTHGDSRINPLYRLFPVQSVVTKVFDIPADKVAPYAR
ncbi:TPA: hypothetical protein ACGFAK_004609 [Serratia marcescens]|jgi:hypothetical protein|uniref:hypothetical protein n=1 Tax=Serratia TaxID=613 RepID=UPI0010223F35|nr:MULTISPECIES: hypothetical protein [Serratia]MBP1133517.1 hypothetical protein [Serratia sp. PL17]RYM67359.1 hypothetical protein BSQ99_24650 [Serratia liquefaciens]CAE7798546.1 hypothetical protein AI2795V1_4751 [Serratia marcescens]CAH3933226.1 hypothetical protein AI2795V1_4751 [Serratia marcescens]HBL7241656.1 hypothetical protein [Serratia liquefaciens]